MEASLFTPPHQLFLMSLPEAKSGVCAIEDQAYFCNSFIFKNMETGGSRCHPSYSGGRDQED
jgi:hypothetical protein